MSVVLQFRAQRQEDTMAASWRVSIFASSGTQGTQRDLLKALTSVSRATDHANCQAVAVQLCQHNRVVQKGTWGAERDGLRAKVKSCSSLDICLTPHTSWSHGKHCRGLLRDTNKSGVEDAGIYVTLGRLYHI